MQTTKVQVSCVSAQLLFIAQTVWYVYLLYPKFQNSMKGDKKYAEKCYKILHFYLIETKFDTYKL